MNYLLKLPVKYALSLHERMEKEDQFSSEFRSIVDKYHCLDESVDEHLMFKIIHDFNSNYIRLKVVSPKLPKDMNEEIAATFSTVFIKSPGFANYCQDCL